jgi:hypothetical protein
MYTPPFSASSCAGVPLISSSLDAGKNHGQRPVFLKKNLQIEVSMSPALRARTANLVICTDPVGDSSLP